MHSILKFGSVIQSLQDLSVASAQHCFTDATEVSEGCCFLSRGPFFPTHTGTQSHMNTVESLYLFDLITKIEEVEFSLSDVYPSEYLHDIECAR